MNFKLILYYLGQILKVVGLLMLMPVFVGLCYAEFLHILPFLITILLYLGIGFALSVAMYSKNAKLGNKEGIAIVGLAWIVVSLIGALPFVIDGCIPNYIDAFFETASGFTTTGATILTEVEALPKCMLFWRSFTHWLGGMGILVFILAIIPGTDGSTYHLFKFESPGPQVGKLVSKVRHTATILYGMYFALTVLEAILLLFGGIGLFNSIILAMGTAGTGGFSATGGSVGEFGSVYVEVVVMAFMFLFSINFNLYYLIILKHFKTAFFDEELRFYCSYVILAIAAITVNLLQVYDNFATALRYSSFAVLTLSSSTGFATADFSLWPQFSQTILMLCMLFGACAGSTGGGMKASRILILWKTAYAHLLSVVRPHSVQVVKLNRKMLGQEDVTGITKYFLVYVLLFMAALLLLSLDRFDFITNFSSVLSCINNDGPGFGAVVGPYGSYAGFSVLSKIVLICLMFLGRLEIFPILLLFLPKTWAKYY